MAWYGDIMEETRMEKWSTTLGTLTRSPDLVMTITAKQQRMYFKPAREIAMQGVRAKRLLREEAEQLAKELLQRQSHVCCRMMATYAMVLKAAMKQWSWSRSLLLKETHVTTVY